MTVKPHLTLKRWECLLALKASPTLQRRPFLAHELKTPGRNGVLRPSTGPTLSGLEKAGWVERAAWGKPGQGMPFRTGGPVNAWQLTYAGRRAVAACPDEFPGEPVYGNTLTPRTSLQPPVSLDSPGP